MPLIEGCMGGEAREALVMMVRPIVVGTDASQDALIAVEWAAREAARRRAPLRLVSVAAGPTRTAAGHGELPTVDDVLRSVYARELQAAAERAADLAPGLRIETGLLSGSPARALIAASAAASMLVLGTRGIGGDGARGVGLVSGHVVTRAACPVVVVGDQDRAERREIVVAVRDADEDAAALRFAFEEAALRGAGLRAVHAWYWFPPAVASSGIHRAAGPHAGPGQVAVAPRAGACGAVLDTQALSAEAADRLSDMLSRWHDEYPGVQVRHDIVRGHPGPVLADFSGLADLVVLGRRDRHEGSAPSGSVLYAVLGHAHSPVAVIPAS
jgi:nucleotide-binding universal stress UspA family protein